MGGLIVRLRILFHTTKASHSGEGKKECEEERDEFHDEFLELVGITVPVLFSLCQ